MTSRHAQSAGIPAQAADKDDPATPETSSWSRGLFRHEYVIHVGNIRAATPQEIRDTAISQAVNDAPDPGATYQIDPGYPVRRCENPDGKGGLLGISMKVRVSVRIEHATWTAPADADPRQARGTTGGHDA